MTAVAGGGGTCVVGVDGGGSKTLARVAALDGSTLGEGAAGGSNWESVGVDGAVAAVRVAVEEALRRAGRSRVDVGASVFGLAGVDWPSDAATLHDALAGLDLGGERSVDNDVMAALRAGCRAGWGVASNVGTGAVTAGRNRSGAAFRTMAVGWGEPSGASGMARDALHAVAAAHHRTGPPTSLTQRILDAVRVRAVDDLFERLSRHRLRSSASWAPLIGDAAGEGDGVARSILVAAGERHGAMVVGVADRLAMREDAFDVALSGSVHGARDPFFTPSFAATVAHGCPAAALVIAEVPPVQGAVLLAVDLLAR